MTPSASDPNHQRSLLSTSTSGEKLDVSNRSKAEELRVSITSPLLTQSLDIKADTADRAFRAKLTHWLILGPTSGRPAREPPQASDRRVGAWDKNAVLLWPPQWPPNIRVANNERWSIRPALNAISVINANAPEAERRFGSLRGSLHGIPVIVKDNYDTADMQPLTAHLPFRVGASRRTLSLPRTLLDYFTVQTRSRPFVSGSIRAAKMTTP